MAATGFMEGSNCKLLETSVLESFSSAAHLLPDLANLMLFWPQLRCPFTKVLGMEEDAPCVVHDDTKARHRPPGTHIATTILSCPDLVQLESEKEYIIFINYFK